MNQGDRDTLAIIGAGLGIIGSIITIYQAVKVCRCDNRALSFQLYCQCCGHWHIF